MGIIQRCGKDKVAGQNYLHFSSVISSQRANRATRQAYMMVGVTLSFVKSINSEKSRTSSFSSMLAIPLIAGRKIQSKAKRLEKVKRDAENRKLYNGGHLVQRTEPEMKTHISYVGFATLLTEWSAENECRGNWLVEDFMSKSVEANAWVITCLRYESRLLLVS